MVHSTSFSVPAPAPAGYKHWRKPCAVQSALLAALLLATLTAQAQAQAQAQTQAAAKAARPDPLDAKASVPALSYESSFSRYRRMGDEKPVSWRDANDTVTRIGGWRVYAREAQQPDPAPAAMPGDVKPTANAPGAAPATKPADAAPSAKPNESAKPMPAGHGGHKMP